MIGSTINAQRLLLLALRTMGPAAQFRLMGLLYQQRFQAHHNLTDPAFLAMIAVIPIATRDGEMRALFVTEDEALTWIQSVDLRQEVLTAAKLARERGIKGVPFVVINGKYAICGGQNESAYLTVSIGTQASQVNSFDG